MYTTRVTKQFTFEAAHKLEGHDGKCARLHGHSWVMRVTLKGNALHGHGPKRNMLADFGDIKKAVLPIIEQYLDHHYLNETLNEANPTSEFIARWLYMKLGDSKLGDRDIFPLVVLESVEILETCTSAALFKYENKNL